jgi:hypothetical protein
MRSLLILLLCALSLHSFAQSKRTVALLPNVNCISLDTSIVRPSSIQVIHKNEILKQIHGVVYTFDLDSSRLNQRQHLIL